LDLVTGGIGAREIYRGRSCEVDKWARGKGKEKKKERWPLWGGRRVIWESLFTIFASLAYGIQFLMELQISQF